MCPRSDSEAPRPPGGSGGSSRPGAGTVWGKGHREPASGPVSEVKDEVPGVGAPVVAVTRPDDGGRFAQMLRRAGFRPLDFPLTEIVPPEDPGPLEGAVDRLAQGGRGPEGFDVLLLSSRRAVQPVVHRLRTRLGDPPFELPGLDVWAVGDRTARAAARAGLPPARTPTRFHAEALLEEAKDWRDLRGLRIFFPQAEGGGGRLPNGLRDAGASVVRVVAYRTRSCPDRARRLVDQVERHTVDVVPLTAGSAARVLAAAWYASMATGSPRSGERASRPWPDRVPIVAIGPATRAVAESCGLPIRSTAEPHTLEGVLRAIGDVV